MSSGTLSNPEQGNQPRDTALITPGDKTMSNIKLYRHALSGHSHRAELLLSLLQAVRPMQPRAAMIPLSFPIAMRSA